MRTSGDSLRDLYRCHDEQEMTRLLELLREANIEFLVRDHSSSVFPTTVGHGAEQILAVQSDDWDHARTLIAEAVSDSMIPYSGELLE